MNTDTCVLLKLCDIASIPEGGILRVELAGHPPFAVYRTGGDIYVSHDTCTHGEASLSDGDFDVDEGFVICPFHLGAFDVRTGEVVAAPCTEPLKVFPVVLRDGAVFIEGAD